MTPPPELSNLPIWEQIGAVVAFIAAVAGVVHKAWKSDDKTERHSDTVVVSGAFADQQPIRDFIAATDRLSDAINRFDTAQAGRSGQQLEALGDIAREQARSTRELHGIRDDIAGGVSVRATPVIDHR